MRQPRTLFSEDVSEFLHTISLVKVYSASVKERSLKLTTKNSVRAKAAQYVLLCRISPALRHRFVGRLHPIGLAAGVADRQLRADNTNLAGARDSVAKIQVQVREAIVSCIETLAWLTGEEAASVALKTGVDSCIALVRTDSEMRGITISSEIAEVDIMVSQRALRTVLTASLLAMVDSLPQGYCITLRSVVLLKSIEIHFHLHLADATWPPSVFTEKQPLRWSDVKALAENEGVEVFRTGKQAIVKCRFDALVAKTQSESRNISPACNP